MPKRKPVDATPRGHGKCLGCGENSKLVDGYLCGKCFAREGPDFAEK